MHFYIDESGHTGPNLFDPAQPMLYYGVLSSKVNVDVLAEERLKRLRTQLGVARLHAAELGNGRLEIGERRVGKECLWLCISRWSPYH